MAVQQLLAAIGAVAYTTLDPAKKGAGVTLSNGNLTAACSGGSVVLAIKAVGGSEDKYCEFTVNSATEVSIGVHSGGGTFNNMPGFDGTNSVGYYGSNGNVYYNGSTTGTSGASYGAGDVIGVRLQAASNALSLYKNGVLQATYTNVNVSGKVYMAVGSFSGGSCNVTANFGPTMAYSIPSGSSLITQ